jgi:hypothetical protein
MFHSFVNPYFTQRNKNVRTLTSTLPYHFLIEAIISVYHGAMQVEEARKLARAQAKARTREAALLRQELAREQREEQQAKVGSVQDGIVVAYERGIIAQDTEGKDGSGVGLKKKK